MIFKLRTYFILFSILIIFSKSSFSQIKTEAQQDIDFFNDIPMAAMLDSLATSILFKGKNIDADISKLNIYNYAADEVPVFADSVYIRRMRSMRTQSPIKYVYNDDVRRFIDLYAIRRRSQTSRLLGLAAFYFPLFEEQLAKHNLPLELKYLAIIESALNPKAISKAGAAGLWQFMYRTGKMYNLEVTSFVDDRFDPYKATIAACEHFVDLYRVYKDWNLVLAAYNAGSGNVNRAIRRANGELDYWKMRKFLPRETQSYVPIFMAASYVMTYATEHNIYPVYPGYLFEKSDTVTIKQKLTFEQLNEALNVSIEELMVLNPSFKRNVIPSDNQIQYVLKMPQTKIGEFLANQEDIYAFKTLEELINEEKGVATSQRVTSNDQIHTVKAGESLNIIARRYGTTVSHIQQINNLRGTTIHTGQKLKVGVSEKVVKATPPPIPQNTIKETHLIQSEETLRSIAEKYNTTVDKIRIWNQLRTLTITVGQELIIHIPVIEDAIKDTLLTQVEDNIPNTPVDVSVIKKENETPKVNETTEKKTIKHTVKSGDTIWKIAQQYGVTVQHIKTLNNLTSGNIKIGQTLVIEKQDF